MVHKGDLKILSQMLRNLEVIHGKVEFNAPLIVAAPTYNIIDELKDEGDWDVFRNTLVLNLMMMHLRILLVQNMII